MWNAFVPQRKLFLVVYYRSVCCLVLCCFERHAERYDFSLLHFYGHVVKYGKYEIIIYVPREFTLTVVYDCVQNVLLFYNIYTVFRNIPVKWSWLKCEKHFNIIILLKYEEQLSLSWCYVL